MNNINNSNSLVKQQRLTNAERLQFSLTAELRDILIGLILGDLHIRKATVNSNPSLRFKQSTIHDEYLFHLYELFKNYCSSAPKLKIEAADARTGKVYTAIYFNTYCLPCFKTIYNLFYLDRKKIIPSNIGELITPLGLAYWLCDDGGWDKNSTRLHTNSYTLDEVNLLVQALNDKFGLKCSIFKKGTGHVIRISTKSMPVLQELLKDKMPSMMRHKIFGNSSSTFSSNPDKSCL
jgi:hypothetical protein